MEILWIVLSVVALLVLGIGILCWVRIGIVMCFEQESEWYLKLAVWIVGIAFLITLIVLVSIYGIARQVG